MRESGEQKETFNEREDKNMDEQKKYSVVGNVTIGTDEYRDLIERAIEAEKEASDYRSKYWAREKDITKLNEEKAFLDSKVSAYKEFINASEEVTAAYKLFVYNKRQTEEEEI